jgi:CRISPR/Cas system CMR-associated protein Cmr5 small subunit
MKITYNYKINSAITIQNEQTTGLSGVIDMIRFTITATHEDGRVESINSEIGLSLDPENFTPIEEINEEHIKTWLLELMTTKDKEGNIRNAMEELLAKRFMPTEETTEQTFGEIIF